jgi:phage gp45-like
VGSDLLRSVERMLRPVSVRVANLVARAVVKLVDDSTKVQLLQLGVLSDETRDGIERFQNYGFTSVPVDGSEAVVLFVGGRRDHGVALAVDDRRYRLRNLESGAVAVYNRAGSSIVMRDNGDVEITSASGVVTVAGDVEVTGDVTADGVSLKTHAHGPGTYSNSGGAVAGTSGAPL